MKPIGRFCLSILKKIIIVVFVFLLSCALAVGCAEFVINRKTKHLTFSNTEAITYNRVGVVLGTSKMLRRGIPNLYFKYRIQAVRELYSAGKISFVLVSGDNGHMSYNEPRDFKNALIEAGIPSEKIFLDFAGFRTYDSMIRAHKVFGLSRFTVISQQFHNERAIYIARRMGLDVVGYNARDVGSYYGFKTKLREYFARVKVFIDLALKKEPRFLGEPVVIQ